MDADLEGPFDIDDFDDPAVAMLARLDLGSVLIPMPEGGQLQVELTEAGVPSAVWVVTPNGRFTIAAYAAPKTGGLWREVASELAESLRKDSAKVSIKDGPWGREVVGTASGVVRFIGVDGYRWMIRCVVNGPQETIDALNGEARAALADTVVRRGDTPLPVRTPLPVQLPEPMVEQLREAAATQQAAQQADAEQQSTQPAPRRGAEGSAMQQLRSTVPAARKYRRLGTAGFRQRGQAGGAEPGGVRAELVQRHGPQCGARCGGHPVRTDLQGVDRIVDSSDHPQRRAKPGQVGAPGCHVCRGLLHRVGQQWPLHAPRPGQLLGQPGWAGRLHLGGCRGQAVTAELGCRMPRRHSGERWSGRPGPGRQGGQDGHGLPGMRQRPRGRHRRADRDTADGDRACTRCVIQGAQVAVDQAFRLRRRRHQHRPDPFERPGKRPAHVAVVGPGSGQQHRRHTAQIDRHPSILPGWSKRSNNMVHRRAKGN